MTLSARFRPGVISKSSERHGCRPHRIYLATTMWWTVSSPWAGHVPTPGSRPRDRRDLDGVGDPTHRFSGSIRELCDLPCLPSCYHQSLVQLGPAEKAARNSRETPLSICGSDEGFFPIVLHRGIPLVITNESELYRWPLPTGIARAA